MATATAFRFPPNRGIDVLGGWMDHNDLQLGVQVLASKVFMSIKNFAQTVARSTGCS